MVYNNLPALLKAASAALAADPGGHLNLAHRRRIWASLGPREYFPGLQQSRGGLGVRRRFRLAAECARRSMPVWRVVRPEDDSPLVQLQRAFDFHAVKLSNKDFLVFSLRYSNHLHKLTAKRDRAEAPDCDSMFVEAGQAVLAAGGVALRDEEFVPERLDEPADDRDTEWGGQDAAFWAACALSGGVPGNPRVPPNPERLRAFWTWYLTDAVPSVWQLVE